MVKFFKQIHLKKISDKFTLKNISHKIQKFKQIHLFFHLPIFFFILRNILGSGLGLSVSKKLTELFNGTMWFQSQEGLGSTFFFTVTVPYRDASPSVSLFGQLGRRPKILVMDSSFKVVENLSM